MFEQGQVKDYPLAIRHKNGSVTEVLYNASVYKDNSGRVIGVFAAARDISEIKRAEELQKSASAYARSLIEASLDPLVTISPEGKITDVNEATEQATGRTRDELIDTDFADYFTNREKAREGYQRAFKEGQVRDYPLAIRSADGRIRDVLYNASVYKGPGGAVKGVFAAARDITTRKMSEQTLQDTAKTLRQSNRELEQFAYAASHDLQAPLRAIRSYLQFLDERLRDSISAEDADMIDRSVAAADRMRELIEGLLAFSRVERRGSPFKTTSLTECVERAKANLAAEIEQHGAVVEVEELPEVQADDMQITALFQNLIGNALKYRSDAAPSIRITSTEEERGLLLCVADNGVGIDPEHHERVFGMFQRLVADEEKQGTGIGLALCRRIAERHGGRIWVESEVGSGSRFYVLMSWNPARTTGAPGEVL